MGKRVAWLLEKGQESYLELREAYRPLDVTFFQNPYDFLTAVKGGTYGAVVTGLFLEGFDLNNIVAGGLEFADKLNQTGVPVVISTAWPLSPQEEQMISKRFPFIYQPFYPPELGKIVDSLPPAKYIQI